MKIGLSKEWFGKDLHKPKGVNVLFHNKYFHIYWNYFQHGYRHFGVTWYSHKALAFSFGTGNFVIDYKF